MFKTVFFAQGDEHFISWIPHGQAFSDPSYFYTMNLQNGLIQKGTWQENDVSNVLLTMRLAERRGFGHCIIPYPIPKWLTHHRVIQ
jgi:hypothetical protein